MSFISVLRKAEVSIMRFVLFVWKKIAVLYKKIAGSMKVSGKKYLKTGLLALLVLYVIGAVVFGIRLYKQKRFETPDRYASYVYPFPVASVGRAIIFDKELQQKVYWSKTFASKMQMEIPENIAQKIIDDMVYDATVMQEASRMKIKVGKSDVDQTFSIAAAGIGGEEQATNFVKESYDMSINQFKQLLVPKIALEKIRDSQFLKVKARHILIKDDKHAQDILDKARGGAKFEDLAKDNSEDQGSKDDGGLLAGGEFLFKGETGLAQQVEDAMFALKPGEISNIVKTDLGNEIIRVDERQGAIELTMTDWLSSLSKKYPVRIAIK